MSLSTRGNGDVRDITAEVARLVRESGLRAGVVTVFCPGFTGALTTIEYEDGVIADLQQVLDEIVPPFDDALCLRVLVVALSSRFLDPL